MNIVSSVGSHEGAEVSGGTDAWGGLIRVFFSSPEDVRQERDQLADLISEINDTLTFLAPENPVRFELIQHFTHAFPDVDGSSAQAVIDRLIPADVDVFVGAMWRRCGTPTGTHPSGTIAEFHRAYEHRRLHGRPTIMFYFCEQQIEMPKDPTELAQLKGVIDFREQLKDLGYTATYARQIEFRKEVRGAFLRAVSSILKDRHTTTSLAVKPPVVIPQKRDELANLAVEYDCIRGTMSPGTDRTKRMERLFQNMLKLAPATRGILGQLQTDSSAGRRLGAIAILQRFPEPNQFNWLVERLDPDLETPFVGYRAAVALLEAVRNISVSDASALNNALVRAYKLASRNLNDPPRLTILRTAQSELQARLHQNADGDEPEPV